MLPYVLFFLFVEFISYFFKLVYPLLLLRAKVSVLVNHHFQFFFLPFTDIFNLSEISLEFLQRFGLGNQLLLLLLVCCVEAFNVSSLLLNGGSHFFERYLGLDVFVFLSLTNFAFTNALPKPLKNSIFHLKSLASDVEILNNSILNLTHSNFQFFVRFHR